MDSTSTRQSVRNRLASTINALWDDGKGMILLIILAPIFAVFVLATVLLGLGMGLFGTSHITILSDTYSDNRTTAASFSQASGNLGNPILPVIAGFVAAAAPLKLFSVE